MSTHDDKSRYHFFAEKSLQDDPRIRPLLAELPDLHWIADYKHFQKENIVREKQCVIFARKRGAWLKPFHCYDNSQYSYLSLDIAEGCLFDCVYCYLQAYLNHGALVLFVNIDELQPELAKLQGNCWISTGLLSDSLLAEAFYPVMASVSRWAPPNCVVELRTKSADITPLNNSAIDRSSVVISWSLNPETVATRYEYRAASLESRLRAAHAALDLGYRIAFHFDPVFYFDGWRDAYEELFHKLSDFPASSLAFLSVGLFRYMPELGTTIRRRFPFHEILTQEFFPDSDGKYHYFRQIRKEMYGEFQYWLKAWKDVPVFWSMEPDSRLRRSM